MSVRAPLAPAPPPSGLARRVLRERHTIQVMIRMYCRDRHGGEEPCAACAALDAYAMARLDRCPFLADKPTCAKCPVHCYAPQRREQVRAVMRHAGPRMAWRHPWLAVCHLVDGWFAGRGAAARRGR